jgi:hypothetical protein
MNTYTPLIPVGLMFLAFCLRKFTPRSAWFHTAAGAFAIATASGLLDTIGEAVQSKGLNAASLVAAVCSFLLSLMAMSNPSLRKGDEESPKMILPGEISKYGFIPILFAGAMLVSGCGAAGGKAWTACELGKLPAIGQTAFATAHDIADNQSSTAADLTTAALALAPGQFDCAAKALLAWLEGQADAPAEEGASVQRALLVASNASAHEHARGVLREYLRGKPTSCRPVKVALLEPCFDPDTCRPVVVDDDVPERLHVHR